MSLVGQSQVHLFTPSTGPTLDLHVGDAPTLDIQTKKGPQQGGKSAYVSTADLQSRAAQMKMLGSLKEGGNLKDRDVSVANVLSKDGMTAVIGRASKYASIKDSMMRGTYKLLNKRRDPGEGFGSLHKSALRLADKYQEQVKAGAPEGERMATLRELKETLGDMKAKKNGDDILMGRFDQEKSEATPVAVMIRFVEAEMGMKPSAHLEKGRTMWEEEYPAMKREGLEQFSTQSKIEHLTTTQDHLKAAISGGLGGDENEQMLEDVTKELDSLKGHAPMKEELEAFVKDKGTNLKHVHTRVGDPVGDMRAKVQQQKFMKEVTSDRGQAIGHLAMNREIRGFDKSTLNKVQTEERTGLQSARDEMQADSLIDEMALEMDAPEKPQGESLVHDPDIGHLTGHTTESEVFKGMGTALQKAVGKKDDGAIAQLGEELGHLIAEDLRQHPQEAQLGFATSRGDAFKKELLTKLNDQLEGGKPLAEGEEPSPRVKAFLDKAYQTAVGNLSDRYVDGNTIELDGVTYTKVGEKGAGANGTVDLYEGIKDGEKHQIILKTPIVKDDSPEEMNRIFNETANEARLHHAATGKGHPNVTGFLGAMQTPDGRVLVAMEYAELGSMHKMTDTLQKAVESGQISPQAANLVRITLLRDMASGLQHLQESQGMTHLDLKPANYFLNGDGEDMLGDFGTAGMGSTRTLGRSVVDSADYTAPEYMQGKKEMTDQRGEIGGAKRKLKEDALAELDNLPKKKQAEFREQVKGQMEAMEEISGNLTFQVTDKADVWALGTSAFQLFFNEKVNPAGAGFVSEQERDLIAFGSDKDNRHQGVGLDGEGNKTGMGVTSLDRLLNSMLHPDPDKRPSMNTVLSSSLFTEPGVGSEDVRELIKVICGGNPTPDALKAASDKLGV